MGRRVSLTGPGWAKVAGKLGAEQASLIAGVLLQGATLTAVARRLKLSVPLPARKKYPIEYVPSGAAGSGLVEVEIPDSPAVIGKRIMDLHLPERVLIVLVSRGEDFLAPGGATELERGDRTLVLALKEDSEVVRRLVSEAGEATGA